MLSNTELALGPDAILETDILPNNPESAGHQDIASMMDVFSR